MIWTWFRFPFDWKTPFGYLIAFRLQYITLAHVFQFIALLVSVGIGFFLLTITMLKDLKRTVRALKSYNQNEMLSMNQLYDFIKFHSITKQLSLFFIDLWASKWEREQFKFNLHIFRLIHDISNIAQPMNMIVFSWSCGALCLVMLTIKLELVE